MIKNKGFTLVELLAAIVILGIILALAASSIGSTINNARIKGYIANEEEIVKATQSYIIINQLLIPKEEGDTTEVPISELRTAKLIGKVKSPDNNSKECSGYVIVTKVGDNEYEYTPHINCEKSIASSAEDALLLHYSFDDFQEPTTNIVINPSGSIISNGVPGSYKPGWDTTLHNDAITVTSWNTGYNSGVPSPSIGYHAKWVYKNGDNTDPVMLFTDKNNEYGLGHRWLGIPQSLNTTSSYGFAVGDKVTISWNQKADTLGMGGDVGLHHTKLSTGTTAFGSNRAVIKVKEVNKWERVSFTSTIDSDWDLTKGFAVYVYGNTGNYGKLWVDDVQIEKKGYATPFINGSRAGIIQDNSVNNIDATLSTTNTPKWTKDAIIGDGAYQFDGVDDYISMSNSNINNTQALTVSAWVKYNTFGAVNSSRPYVSDWNTWSPGNQKGFILRSSGSEKKPGFWIADGNNYFSVISSKELNLNTWYLVTGVFNANSILKIYVNGEEVGSATAPSKYIKEDITPIYIGKSGINAGYFDGTIDDIRIYGRALTASEIKNYYELTKMKNE
jgi:prepilin-type N-terminal cleavage/methylation domain-containing protein